MHKNHLPLKVDPIRFAENAITLEGILLIKNLPRLCSTLDSDEGDIDLKLTFRKDEQKIPTIRINLSAFLPMKCQRCMESFKYEIIDDFVLGVVNSEEQADELPERLDPVFAKDGELFLGDMIEEEILVRLPIVPMHDSKECIVKFPLVSNVTEELEKTNPFKVIEILRSKRNKE